MSDFPEKAEDKVNTLAVVVIGLATTAILWASVLALQAFFMNTEGEIAAERAQQGRANVVRDLKAKHRNDLGESKMADHTKGTLKRLKIERAKEVVVRDALRGAGTLIPTLGPLDTPTIGLDGKVLEEKKPTPPPAAVDGKPGTDGIAVDAAGVPIPVDGVTPAPAPAPAPAPVPPPTANPAPETP